MMTKTANPDPAPTPDTTKRKSWRDAIAIHPAAEIFPVMEEAQLRVLGEDIRRHGLLTPIVITVRPGATCGDRLSEFILLDGRNRLDAMELVGIPFELIYYRRTKQVRLTQVGDQDEDVIRNNDMVREEHLDDPYDFVLSANLHRRHLTSEDKRDLIAKVLKAKPELSDRQIGAKTGASHTTVAKVRSELEDSGDVAKIATSVDTKGREQPRKRKNRIATDAAKEAFRQAGKVAEGTSGNGAAEREAPDPTTAGPRAAPPAFPDLPDGLDRRAEHTIVNGEPAAPVSSLPPNTEQPATERQDTTPADEPKQPCMAIALSEATPDGVTAPRRILLSDLDERTKKLAVALTKTAESWIEPLIEELTERLTAWIANDRPADIDISQQCNAVIYAHPKANVVLAIGYAIQALETRIAVIRQIAGVVFEVTTPMAEAGAE